ncbi:MAG: carboxypeptidase regulatory-like domain-containing protein [Phycisphaerales bacterium]|nr:carboxypeptidase regulatory-like domain-containing protein [Phycisphaerales bacterium]
MQGRLLLGAGAVLALVWWVAHEPVVAGARSTEEDLTAETTVRVPTLRANVEAPRRALVTARPAALGAGPPAEPRPTRRSAAHPAAPATLPRDILVVDDARCPVVGAEISTSGIYRSDGSRGDWGNFATTDGSGRARIDVGDGWGVTVCSTGFRLTSATRPAADVDWVVVLKRALRLEVSVVGPVDFTGLHVRVDLPRDCAKGQFYQSKYQQTPGRAVAGTIAHWTGEQVRDALGAWRWDRYWSVCLSATGTAVLDQIDATGKVKVQLRRFARVLDERHVEVTPDRGSVRLLFQVAPTEALHGVVTDGAGRALADAQLRMAPCGGARIVDSPRRGEPFPVWAPATRTDANGRFTLPRGDVGDERIVVTSPGHAARAVTIAEVDAAQGAIRLQPGRTVRIEILDCNEKPLEGGWTTGGHEYAEPSVLIGHDVWRGTSDRELPWFEFVELPPSTVTFRCAGEQLQHDARVPFARLVTEGPVEMMGIGK